MEKFKITLAKYYDDPDRHPDIVEEAVESLTSALEERDGPAETRLLTVYYDMEKESREKYPQYAKLLMSAIIAGENALTVVPKYGTEWQGISLSLATLFMRRSNWDGGIMFSDVDLAVSLMEELLDQKIDALGRVKAYCKLSAILEEKWERTRDEDNLRQAIQNLDNACENAEGEELNSLRMSVACLRFKLDRSALKCILEISLKQLPTTPVSFSSVARKKYRFIDSRSLASGESLRVLEFDYLPLHRYVALSYVWRGSHTEGSEQSNLGTMTIEGAVGADPISIEVLITICTCLEKLGCELLWLDGVCIIQNDEEDKGWQIQNMFNIYKHCKQCLVLPGGLSRLVELTEPTPWIHRAWTLQEAVVPESAKCLFSWTRGDATLQSHFPCFLQEIEVGKSAMTDLRWLLMISLRGEVRVLCPPTAPWDDENTEMTTVRLLIDTHEHSQAETLLGAIDYRGREGMGNAIWRSALTRVAMRPVDTVFSIMGLFGVSLNPLLFSPTDRKGATIALMQAMLRNGERAEWLGAAQHMQINADIPTLPIFPTVDERGSAVVITDKGKVPISKLIGSAWWRIEGAPSGEMDDQGALTVHVQTLAIRQVRQSEADLEIRPKGYSEWDGTPLGTHVWYTASSLQEPPFIIRLGRRKRYTNAAYPVMHDPRPYLVMIVESAGSGLVSNLGYADIGEQILGLPGWAERKIVIAGTSGQDTNG